MRRSPAPVARPEAELLLCCARTCLDAAAAARIRTLLREAIDWDGLVRTARRHAVTPQLYQSLLSACPDVVPQNVLGQLRDQFHANAARNLILTGELLRLLALFEANGIRAMPFKGPVLAAAAYGDLSLRQFWDLDILVFRHDVLRIRDLLVRERYRPQFEIGGRQAAAYLRSQCELLLTRDEGRSVVEAHWEVTPRYFCFPLDPERLWERRKRTSLEGKEVLTLSPEDLLLILCAHGTKHLWERLGWVRDVAALIGAHQATDWHQLVDRAGRLGGRRMLLLGVSLARELLGASLPEEMVRQVDADPAIRSLAGEVRSRLLHGRKGSPTLMESCLFHLRARERLRDRIRYCVRLAVTTTPGDWALLPLPAPLFPVYSLLRPMRLAAKYGLGAVRRLRRVRRPGPAA